MGEWAVVRVAAVDGSHAVACLITELQPITVRIDTNPPAAGPEWELRVQDQTESAVCGVLRLSHVDVLASKTAVDQAVGRDDAAG